MAPERTSRPGGNGLPGMRNSALATAALTSVALLSQTAGAAAATGDDAPSRDEVQQRVNSLYDRAETDTGNYNATRAAAIPRQRGGAPASADRRGAGPATGNARETAAPALTDVARQWFDVARTKLGPTTPAVLPSGRTPARPTRPPETRPPRPAERPANALEGPRTPDRAVPELTAGSAPELTARSVPALPSAAEPSQDAPRALSAASTAPAVPAADSGSSPLRATKQRNQQKLARAGELLAAHRSAQLSTPLTAIESRPAEATWPAPAEPDFAQTGTQWQLLPQTDLTPDLPTTPSYPPSANLPAAPSYAPAADLPVTADPTFVNPLTADPAPALTPGLPVDHPAFTTTSGLPTVQAPAYGANLPTDPAPMPAPGPVGPAFVPTPDAAAAPGSAYATNAMTAPATALAPGLTVDPAFTPSHVVPVTPTPGLPHTQAPAYATNPPAAATFTPGNATSAYPAGLPTDQGFPPGLPVTPAPAYATTAPVDPIPVPAPVAPVPAGQAADAGYDLKAAKVVAFARAQIGRPCVWGAAGPGSYDAAGLTQASWKAAGVGLPRTAQGQATVGTAVPLAEVRVGDLIFFFDDLSHVGLFVGNGTMIHAPGPGSYIREESVFHAGESAIRGAVRPA
ncbi:NlpC/P60 family protein [Streptomyces sp. NBC_00076]|uniref:C40 family peptidase n=1 Tax=Streptomyces sp. NBC_00076 TaxID=2975642 RepID=UPI003253A837